MSAAGGRGGLWAAGFGLDRRVLRPKIYVL